MTEILRCMNCIYVITPMHESLQCCHPKCGKIDPETEDWVCDTTGYARSGLGECGPEGKLYQEPKR